MLKLRIYGNVLESVAIQNVLTLLLNTHVIKIRKEGTKEGNNQRSMVEVKERKDVGRKGARNEER